MTPNQPERTKYTDGEYLTAACFLIVEDFDDTKTWKLPFRFADASKVANHLRNGLGRFNETKAPAYLKRAAWVRLVEMCRNANITVTDLMRQKLTARQLADLDNAVPPPRIPKRKTIDTERSMEIRERHAVR